jgi:hypothetical protein
MERSSCGTTAVISAKRIFGILGIYAESLDGQVKLEGNLYAGSGGPPEVYHRSEEGNHITRAFI